jgi:hypothetical protein
MNGWQRMLPAVLFLPGQAGPASADGTWLGDMAQRKAWRP